MTSENIITGIASAMISLPCFMLAALCFTIALPSCGYNKHGLRGILYGLLIAAPVNIILTGCGTCFCISNILSGFKNTPKYISDKYKECYQNKCNLSMEAEVILKIDEAEFISSNYNII